MPALDPDTAEREAPVEGDCPKRGRPRSGACHRAVLDAAAELFDEDRYADVTMEGIAARAGVAKQTLYKWWPTKAKIALEVYATRFQIRATPPDTGSIEAELSALLLQSCRRLRRGNRGALIAGLIADAQRDLALLHDLRETLVASRRRCGTEILKRGVARGELRADVDMPLVLDLLYGPLWYRLLLQNAPLDDAFARATARHVVAGIRA